ncbi:MAG: serine/threonine-protein kinase [Acidobacteriota bacterium]|nr:serine/threonine-protein kinase [Acidobacteriota bacterium]
MNPGERYGRYQIVRIIGRGAMGEVYLADDTETPRRIALKVVYKGPDPDDEEVLEAERLGAELQKRLGGVDQRVVIVNRYGSLNGDLFIEMEYIEGEDLSTILAREALPPRRAAEIAAELCEMLENLRDFTTTIADKNFTGVIHGDLKPKNIRISASGEVKALDFGIAKALSHTRKQTLNVFASTAYCSPERVETHSMDTHSDLWSVGVLLYQMISGSLPFEEPTKERLERRIRFGNPPDPLPEACPEPLRNIVFTMLARDPARRYQSATDVRLDLTAFLAGAEVSARPVDNDATVRTSVPANVPASGDSDATVRTTPSAPPRRPQIAYTPSYRPSTFGCFAAFLGFGIVGLIVFLWQNSYHNDAVHFQTELQTERIANLDQAWTHYQQLAARRHVPLLLWGAQRALKNRLVSAADQTILEYRNNDAPAIYENQWKTAHEDVVRAYELDPGDSAVKGRMRLCEGHLDRIDAKGAARQKKLSSAIAKFQEAADLLKKWPDPYLGLARLYAYDLGDMDRAEEAINKAVEYNHPMGKREQAQLADGYHRRADRTWRDSRAFTQHPAQEKDYLEKARQDYLRAQDLYQRIGVWGDSTRSQMQVLQGLQRIEQRLAQMQGTGTP